ncbi:NADH-quinone oxidoreductase subunit NuoK [Pedobacter sp. HMF7647]|uniref:NADH-quinone oxidoreductase subunit K n=1 Tax=Hufsiella arboris TaxID=2695275 RepID=A0A7K1YBJ5_9SPHI|nr:NADH-quinone oxidoreductase subunit NuoK [Hufsiella arboris]MXV51408.1 NADH-quinone oxidoreductase subunit NuoK [Hufsiella arboris]
MIPLSNFMMLSAALFVIGLYAVLVKRNVIQLLIGIEFMINAALINFVAAGKSDKNYMGGQMTALFTIVIAAASVAVALAIILNVYKYYKSIDPDKLNKLRD